MENDRFKMLSEEFPPDDIEWRIQSSGIKADGQPWAIIVPFINNRAIMDRLDSVFGPENWRNEYVQWPGGGVLCGISIRTSGTVSHIGEDHIIGPPEWITKWDGAEAHEESDARKDRIDSIKSVLSNSMKRAAVQWGIGRYLYSWEACFADFCKEGGNRVKIKDKAGKDSWYNWMPPAQYCSATAQKPVGKPEPRKAPPPPSQPGQGTPSREQHGPDTGEAATEPQKKAVHAIAKDKGLERPQLFGIITEQLGRPIDSTDALTKREASKIIEVLNSIEKKGDK